MNYSDLKEQMIADSEHFDDALDPDSESGAELLAMISEVEDDMGIIQGREDTAEGNMVVFSWDTSESIPPITSVHFEEFIDTIVKLATDSTSAEEFKEEYAEYLKGLIEAR